MAKLKDITGNRYGRLVVTGHAGTPNRGKTHYWWCLCDCGTKKQVASENLKQGKVVSCGCHNRQMASKTRSEIYTHKESGSTEYRSWLAMKTRCYNQNYDEYEHYGDRGVSVCERWLNSFENFLEDMGKKPTKNHSLDRIDVDGNYEPSNCRWATTKEQSRNKRITTYIDFQGEALPLVEVAERYGLWPDSIRYAINNGENAETVVNRLRSKHE